MHALYLALGAMFFIAGSLALISAFSIALSETSERHDWKWKLIGISPVFFGVSVFFFNL